MIYLQCGDINSVKISEADKIKLVTLTCVCKDAQLCPKTENKLTMGIACFLLHARQAPKLKIALPDAKKEVLA
jgi:hypothetical protein